MLAAEEYLAIERAGSSALQGRLEESVVIASLECVLRLAGLYNPVK